MYLYSTFCVLVKTGMTSRINQISLKMNRISLLILFLFSALCGHAETDSISSVSYSTRKYTLTELIPEAGLRSSPLLEVFKGLHPEKIRDVYHQNRLESDSTLAAKQLEPVWWRSLLYQAGNFFRQKSLTPMSVLAILTPILLLVIIGISIVWIVMIFILPSGISQAERPETDMIEAEVAVSDDEPVLDNE